MQLAQLDVTEQVGQLSTLARQDSPVAVRNQLPGITTFTDETTHVSLIWQGNGDAKGGDVKEVHPSMLLNPQFRENVLRGIFKIEVDPAVLDRALNLQRQDWDQRQVEKAGAAAQIEKANANVVAVGVACIAPKSARELCGSYALVMGEHPEDGPPLCAEHIHLAPQYEAQKTGRLLSNNREEIVWKRKSAVPQ